MLNVLLCCRQFWNSSWNCSFCAVLRSVEAVGLLLACPIYLKSPTWSHTDLVGAAKEIIRLLQPAFPFHDELAKFFLKLLQFLVRELEVLLLHVALGQQDLKRLALQLLNAGGPFLQEITRFSSFYTSSPCYRVAERSHLPLYFHIMKQEVLHSGYEHKL